MSRFLSDLIVREIDDGTWEVRLPLEYQSDLLTATVTVPLGFKTDFASVPRVPFVFDVLGDIAHDPAVIHDALYFSGQWERKLCDQVFLEAMAVSGINWFKKYQIYFGVRLGGWIAWNNHRKAGHALDLLCKLT